MLISPRAHPDAKLLDPYFRYRRRRPELGRAARRALERPRPTIADSCGPSLGELLKLKSEGAALRVQLALIRQEIAVRKARGLAPLRDSDPDWQAFLRNVARYQDACRKMRLANPGYLAGLDDAGRKAGFDPDQPRVPSGNPDGGRARAV